MVVLGSGNMDLVMTTERLPRPGETVAGVDTFQSFGGKGANQAVAAARAGAAVTFVAALGADAFGEASLAQYAKEGINVAHVKIAADRPTGQAMILVDREGRNMIAVAAGANGALGAEDIWALPDEVFEGCGVFVAQLETPLEAVKAGLERAKRAGALTILNPAPAPDGPLRAEVMGLVDLIAPNETEAERLTGIAVEDEAGARRAADALIMAGAGGALITLGARGSVIHYPAWGLDCVRTEAERVVAVDTVAAGDAFIGALAARLAEGIGGGGGVGVGEVVLGAIRFATRAAGISVTRRGAQPSLAKREEIEAADERGWAQMRKCR